MRMVLILLLVLVVSALAITAGEIEQLHSELMELMDKYTWEYRIDGLSGDTLWVTDDERAAVKVLACAKCTEHKQAIEEYARQLGIID